jgi:hypothetical protein
MPELTPTVALIELMADIKARRVLENENDLAPYLDIPGDNPKQVGDAVWAMERAGWCWLPADTLVWHLTDRGREVLDRGAA